MKHQFVSYLKTHLFRAMQCTFVFIAMLAFAACDAGTGSTGTTSTPVPTPVKQKAIDVCSLVTATEMGKVVGGQFTATEKTGKAAGEAYCVYKNSSNPGGSTPSIDLLAQNGLDAWNGILSHKNDTAHYTQTDVDGTTAIFEQTYSRLWIYKKGYTMIISVYLVSSDGTTPDSAKGLDFTKQIAHVALQRL